MDRAKAARGYLVTQASYSIKSSHPKFAAYLRGEEWRCVCVCMCAWSLCNCVCVLTADMHPLVLEVGLGRVPVASLCVGTATVSNIKNLVAQNSVEG